VTLAITSVMQNTPAHESVMDGEFSTHSAGEQIDIVIRHLVVMTVALCAAVWEFITIATGDN
jgi:hypothetical protein